MKEFTAPKVEIEKFSLEDVITTSVKLSNFASRSIDDANLNVTIDPNY